MNSEQLIDQYENLTLTYKLKPITIKVLDIIITHYKSCEYCRREFDLMELPGNTIEEIEKYLNANEAEAWLCE